MTASPSSSRSGRARSAGRRSCSLPTHDPMSALSREVFDTLAHALQVDPREVHLKADLVDDLGADVSSAALVLLALEEAFDVDLEEEIDGERLRTVEDVVAAVASAMMLDRGRGRAHGNEPQ